MRHLPFTLVGLVLIVAVLLTPATARAGALTCLTGTDPSVAGDLTQITAVRASIDSACVCASFDGSPGNAHSNYVKCAKATIAASVAASTLRTQCKGTVTKYYSNSTCGVPASQNKQPCIKKTLSTGKVTCAIASVAKCTGDACPLFTTCIDAADTNHDGLIGAGDAGTCNSTCPSGSGGFIDNGDGTVTDCTTQLMWEKKDKGGGVHEVTTNYSWAGLCGCATGACTGSEPMCQPSAAAASACVATTGGALGCARCVSGTCNIDPFGLDLATTVWEWVSQLNAAKFAGHHDWRVPTVGQESGTAELETLQAHPCPGAFPIPCVPPAFNTACVAGCNVTGCSCTAPYDYWSAITSSADPTGAWAGDFQQGGFSTDGKFGYPDSVRAVRGTAVAPVPTPTTPARTPTAIPTAIPTPIPCTFHDNGDGTITDQCTGLMWEKKDQSGGTHDVTNAYPWAGTCSVSGKLCQPGIVGISAYAAACAAATGGAEGCTACGAGEGTCSPTGTIWYFLEAQLNLIAGGFAGHTDWRIPTFSELQTILAAQFPNCTGSPCVPAAFNNNCPVDQTCTVTTCSCTLSDDYWSATSPAPYPGSARTVAFQDGDVDTVGKPAPFYVRAVR